MQCERCGRADAAQSSSLFGENAGYLCVACRDEEGRARAAEDEGRIRDMTVDWDAARPLMMEAEARGIREQLMRMADVLEHVVVRYGRVLPPDFAAFLTRHRRSRPSV